MNSPIPIFAILFFGIALMLVAPWPKLAQERSGEDFALLFIDDGSSDLESLECSEARPCYVAWQPQGFGGFVHFYHYPHGRGGDVVGMSYNMASNGGGGWVLHDPGHEPRAHAGPFHRADPLIEGLRQGAVAHGCVLPSIFSRDETPRGGEVECELVVIDRATLAYRLNAVRVESR